EPLARPRVDGVRPRAAVEAVHLPVDVVRGPPVGQLLRGLGHKHRQLVEVGHRRHAGTLPRSPGLQWPTPGGVPEWPKGTGCKPVGSAYGGSNPPAPIGSIYREIETGQSSGVNPHPCLGHAAWVAFSGAHASSAGARVVPDHVSVL